VRKNRYFIHLDDVDTEIEPVAASYTGVVRPGNRMSHRTEFARDGNLLVRTI